MIYDFTDFTFTIDSIELCGKQLIITGINDERVDIELSRIDNHDLQFNPEETEENWSERLIGKRLNKIITNQSNRIIWFDVPNELHAMRWMVSHRSDNEILVIVSVGGQG